MAWAKGMTPSLLKKTTPVMKDIPPKNSSYIPEGSLWKETVEKYFCNSTATFRINLRTVLQIALCTLLHDKIFLNLHTIIKATVAGHTPIIR